MRKNYFTFSTAKNTILIDSRIDSALSIFNLSGRKVYTAHITGGQNEISLNTGIYLIQTGGTVKKVIVK